MTEEQRHDWQMTGKLPDATTPEEKTPSTVEAKTAEPPPAPDKSDHPPEADAGKVSDGGKHKTAAERKAELAADIQQHLRERADLRAENDRLRKERQELTAPQPVAADKPAPKEEDYETTADFLRALATFEADQRVTAAIAADRKERTDAAAKEEAERRGNEIATSWKEKTAAAAKVYPDFEDALQDNEFVAKIAPGSLLDAAILHRPEGAHVYHYLWKNPDEFARISKLVPLDQAYELAAIEQKIVQSRVPVKKVTGAPPPPTEVAGKGTPADDEAAKAANEGDFTAYKHEMDRREARKK
jgi:hypothetical protein